MKIALIGNGRMGREVERLAREEGHDIVAVLHPSAADPGRRVVTPENLVPAEVCVDFSIADAALDHVRAACRAGVPLVSGVTGWDDRLDEARELVEQAGVGMVHAPNFALGVQAMLDLVARAAALLGDRPGADVSVFERHHRGKADAPSGTARRLAETLLAALASKTRVIEGSPPGAPAPGDLRVVSERVGAEPGTHTVTFDLGDETLELRHAARGRSVFARGALLAAQWLPGRPGLHTFDEVLGG